MAMKIRVRGASKEEAKPKAKPAKSRPAKRAAKPAAKAPAKRGPGRPRKSESESTGTGRPRRYKTSDIDAREEAKLVKLVEKAGDRRRKAEEEHKESVSALHEAAAEALQAGVSMAKVADASGISRQWLYKMGDFADRSTQLRAGNGKSNGKSEAKSVKRPPAKRNTRTQSASKPKAKAKAKPGRKRVTMRSK